MTSVDAQSRLVQVSRKSVTRLKEFARAGSLTALGRVDPLTGEVQDPEARALFASLPIISPATAAEELVSHGLIPSQPRGLLTPYETPKYRVGRELFVRTSVNHEQSDPHRPVGEYQNGNEPSFTHRGVLKAQRGDNFLVAIDGAAEPLPFGRTDVYAWNEASGAPSSGGTVSGVQIDYSDPRFKAYVCAGFVDIADEVAELDFDDEPAKVQKAQVNMIHRLASRVRMVYPGRSPGYSGPRAGALIDGGQGVCFVQRAVAGAYLQVFARILAFEVQIAVGRTLRLGVPHGFNVITLRPSLARYVNDPAWSEPLTDLRVAFFGRGWGHDRRLEDLEGTQDLVVRPAEVDLPELEAA